MASCFSARIDDQDHGFESDDWTQLDPRSGQQVPLRADRWFGVPPEEIVGSEQPDCSGIKCNMWVRAKSRRMLTHSLVGGGKYNVGYHGVRWESILQGQVGEYGPYKVLSVLPDKVARYLFEYHAASFSSLNLPALPNDRRDSGTIHSLLNAVQV